MATDDTTLSTANHIIQRASRSLEDHLFEQVQVVFGWQFALLRDLSQHVVNEPLLLIAVTARGTLKALRRRLQHGVPALFHLLTQNEQKLKS